MLSAMYDAWTGMFGSAPNADSVRVLCAQWALETGWGKYMHCYNIGNSKKVDGDGRDYVYYRCNELLNGKWVWFDPKDRASCFRAFSTLQDGVADYVKMVNKNFAGAWPAVIAGDPDQYVRQAKAQGYFTAPLGDPGDPKTYLGAVISIFHSLRSVAVHSGGGAQPNPQPQPDPKPQPKKDPQPAPQPAPKAAGAGAKFDLATNSKFSFTVKSASLEATFTDEKGQPLKSWYYTLEASGSTRKGQLDEQGHVKIDGLAKGRAKLKLTENEPKDPPPAPAPPPGGDPDAGVGRAARFRRMQFSDVVDKLR
jgi:hypothetical protein